MNLFKWKRADLRVSTLKLAPISYQHEAPIRGAMKKELYLVQMLNYEMTWLWEQLGSVTAHLWNSTAVRQPWDKAAPGWSSLTRQLCSTPLALVRSLRSFNHSRRNPVFSFWWKEKVHSPSTRGADLYMDRSSTPGSGSVCPHAKPRSLV